MVGIISDTVLREKNFATIFLLNIILILWDIYLFIEAAKTNVTNDESIVYSIFLGLFLGSADLVYLITIPFLIAKQ